MKVYAYLRLNLMSSFYQNLQKTATTLLKDKGQEVTLTDSTGDVYVPGVGLTPGTTTTQTAVAVLLDYGSREIDGTIITIADKKLLLSGKKIDGTQLDRPKINGNVLVDGINYTIKDPLKELKPNGTVVVLYTLNLRA